MGGELLGDILPRYQLDVYNIHAYSKYYQRDSHQVSRFFLAYNQDDVKTEIFM